MKKVQHALVLITVLFASQVAVGLFLRPSPAKAEVAIAPSIGANCTETILNTAAGANPGINGMVPYSVTSAGVYCLGENLYYTGAGTAITITSGPVVLDFGGRTLAATMGGNIAIEITGGSNYVIRNGSIYSFDDEAIHITGNGMGTEAGNVIIEKMIINAVDTGILVDSSAGPVVIQNNLIQNFEIGVKDASAEGMVVKDNVFSDQNSSAGGNAIMYFTGFTGHAIVERNQLIGALAAYGVEYPGGTLGGTGTSGHLMLRYNSALGVGTPYHVTDNPGTSNKLENDSL